IASDNPTLPPGLIEQAFDRLAEHDVVLGPTDDGGYYLVAARAVHPSLFRDMVWSRETVLEETLRRCRAAGLRDNRIQRWYDVDTPQALAELARKLESLPQDCAVHTRAAVRGLAPNPGSPRVAVIIPVLDEAEIIGRVLDEVPRASVDRLLVVDGGSSDDTRT